MKNLRFPRLERHRVAGTGDQMTLSVPAPRSPSGKVYQYSPNPEAVPRLFLLGDAPEDRTIPPGQRHRIRREPGAGETICPYSGYQGPDQDFTHFDDIKAVKDYVLWLAEGDVHDLLGGLAADFNRRQPRDALITMKMDVRTRRSPPPLAIREDLLRSLDCDVCQRAYAVYALALFCPDCGAPNVRLHFQRETDLVHQQIALAGQQDSEGRAEIAYRLVGNAHEDVLTAFEATLKAMYRHLVRQHLPDQFMRLCAKQVIGAAFQNVDRASALYEHLGIEPFSVLSPTDLEYLKLNIQKRHVLGHNLGVADEYYAEITQDEKPGETVRILGDEIRAFADLCLRVVTQLEKQLLPNRA
ncbi:MAG: hypothetical protein OXI79_02835 [Gammaproteobacteria bacterium]|nr:hypothetical protein [Gammaproteobacteria bacterium]